MQNNTFFGHSQPLPIIVLEAVASTNDYSKQLLANFKPQIDFTAIMAKYQFDGRGQRGTSWLTPAGVNMTASFIYAPPSLSISKQFALTVHSSLAVYDVVEEILQKDIFIKWPNDIMVGKRKIAGILLENKISAQLIKTVIAGIGINVYQQEFPIEIAHKTTSLVLEHPDIDLTILDLVKRIQKRLLYYQTIFEKDRFDALLQLYNNRLFLRGIDSNFIVNGASITGQIQGVGPDGILSVLQGHEIQKYDLKGIIYQL
ncbi:biotin--[acetyl-CoA-carboxylase] ligase [Sphingobacterium faecale]|uniref:Biotin--[acetyl-CoA-carboxylase] ligase n=1 Tax=Sphingobacterium faecale TaxID=2803775 RepID=A0ABS1R6F3_9SPHI|nr:biotin--[acetyl-CoA-carboxylase] ligase [Sphingobacterium faecale]MBL1410282.1 biotin--[acetyl-CoA-carboxylase] ligase [Sphingobacterium faecale]